MSDYFLCSQNNDSKNYGFYQSVFFNFEAHPNFAKTKRGASGGFLPRPLLLRLRHPNSEKRNQPKFCGILFLQKLYTFHILNTKRSKSCESVPHFLTPENCFRKTSSALFQISSSGFISKKVRILSKAYRIKVLVSV